jgi:hypothetical protein
MPRNKDAPETGGIQLLVIAGLDQASMTSAEMDCVSGRHDSQSE